MTDPQADPRTGPSDRPTARPTARPPARRPRRKVRRTMPAMTAWKATVVALVTFALLASGNLVRSAETMPLGWQRSVALPAAKVVDRVANLLSLNRPYDWAAERLGLEQEDADFEFAVDPTEQPDPGASTTTTTLPPLRVPTVERPLRVVVAGDSTAIGVGDRLKVAATDDPTMAVDVQGKVATGLSRSDYFNWGARMKQIVDEMDPEVVVFMVGANDGQSIVDPDTSIVARWGTPEWAEAYRARVAGIMDLAHRDSLRLVWVGQPDVGKDNVQQAATTSNELARQEAQSRPWVTYFDLRDVVGGGDGSFSEYVTFPDGETVRCYSGDGVHLSLACLDRAMDSLLPAIQALYAPG